MTLVFSQGRCRGTSVADDVKGDAEHLGDDRKHPSECHRPDLGAFSLDRHVNHGDVERREHDVCDVRWKSPPCRPKERMACMRTALNEVPGLQSTTVGGW